MPHPPPPRPDAPLSGVTQPIKRMIAARTAAMFHDRSRGERPVTRQADGLFGPHSVAWRVHGDVTSMIVGGVASLLLQMLHPAVLAGVWSRDSRASTTGHASGLQTSGPRT